MLRNPPTATDKGCSSARLMRSTAGKASRPVNCLRTENLRLTMPWIERRIATLAAGLWKCRAMSSLPCASSTSNSDASLMHAIFSISAAPLLRLRWSSVLKNNLHDS